MSYRTYAEYLRHPKYVKVRDEEMLLAGGKCRMCGDKATEVHHATYPKWGTFDVVENLLAVCNSCHTKLHTCSDCGGVLKAEAIKAKRSNCRECLKNILPVASEPSKRKA